MQPMEFPHRRRNPLNGQWVLVSPHRNNRPWHGATEAAFEPDLPAFKADCPLCPAVERANGDSNPDYSETFVFTNDFAALLEDSPEVSSASDELMQVETAQGCARVMCFSPEHDKTLAEMTVPQLTQVVNTWQSQYQELSQSYACIQIFENKGEIMGCSQPHPHGQIWAHHHLSSEVSAEDRHQAGYYLQHDRPLLADYVERELNEQTRIVEQNDDWLAVVPFWAAWPFEILLVARADIRDFGDLDKAQKTSLASILKNITTRYDNLFQCRFPYSMGWHNAPANGQDNCHWRLHAHFYPPLLRSATIKKHMVGYEMLAESQRDLTPEKAAGALRQTSLTHYKETSSD
ncbi:UDP-glucose--hexose-1-phosphate uridylyltransferase [Saliniradius amylolyticus]|uniref:Galactose-1-phosphate uridylyltransferase n=1 Tax=Saliniradius amylolyticus TaxID=2183582 RepID=A0A2S2E616_9ALTE|nr:UDP-glucose--hexose-1-phosphate uridylyltransferase [Saliniradius amylolyticus]AWL13039.1 UDP-glucose--hexose-1-phosphate uridylyltransferase [Saliniradius amylolyticus]